MASTTSDRRTGPLAGHDDLKRILADLDDARILEIVALAPTVAEVEEAAQWAAGTGDALDRAGHTLTGNVAAIVGILMRDQEPPDR